MDHGQRVGRFGAAWVALLVAASSALTATATRPAAARAGAGSGALPAAASPSWQQAPVVGSAPSPRYGSSLAFDGSSDQLVLFGGVGLQSAQNDCGLGFDDLANQGSGVLQSIENGSADLSSLIALADQFGGVAGAAAIADFYDGLCFQHGSQWPIARGDMWTWDGNQWSPVTGIPLPPARTGGALAYDEATHQLLLFGGADSDANALGDTWSWDGRRWQQLHPAHSPSARSGAAMAYDPLLGAVMLYGGWDGLTTNGAAGVEGDTWSWNGSDWTPITIAPDAVHDPPPTSLASMAFDAATGQLVLTSGTANLGGMGVYGLQAADEPQVGASWTWNGTRWVLLSDLQSFDEGDPDASLLITTHGSAMAFDAATGELLGHTDDVLSATSGSGNASDLAWNGSTWVAQSSQLPDAALGSAMAYDPATGQTVLFGGYGTADVPSNGTPTNATWVYGPATSTITNAPAANASYGDRVDVATLVHSSAPFTVASTTPSVCTVAGTSVTMVNSGTCSLSVSPQASSAFNGFSGGNPTTVSFTVAKRPITLVAPSLTSAFHQPVPTMTPLIAGLVPGDSVANGAYTCTTNAPSSDGLLTSPGTWATSCSATTTSSKYTIAQNVSGTLNVLPTLTPSDQAISFAPLAPRAFGAPPFSVSAFDSATLPITFSSDTPSVCTIAGTTWGGGGSTTTNVTLAAPGTCTLRAAQPGNAVYNAAQDVTQSFTVTPGGQTILTGRIPDQIVAGPAVDLRSYARSTANLPLTFTSMSPSVCTIGGGSFASPIGAGTCTVTATQPGNATVGAAPPANVSFVASLLTQTISFAPLDDVPISAGSIDVAASATSQLPVTLGSNTTPVCTVAQTGFSSWHVTLVAVGTCTLQATQGGGGGFAAAPTVTRSFAVHSLTQTLTISNNGNPGFPSPLVINGLPYHLDQDVHTTSGLLPVLSSVTPQVCTVTGGDVNLVRPGRCTLFAFQPGNGSYAPSNLANGSFDAVGSAQTVFLQSQSDVVFDPNAVLGPTVNATSGLPPTLSSDTPATCSVDSSNLVHELHAGVCTLRASQYGDDQWAPAPEVTESFNITKAQQTVDYSEFPPGASGPPTEPFELAASSSAGLPVTLKATGACSGTSTGSILVQATKLGLCTVTATQAGNGDYSASAPNVQTFTYSGSGSDWVWPTIPVTPVVAGEKTKIAIHTASSVPVSSRDGPAQVYVDPFGARTLLGNVTITNGAGSLVTSSLPAGPTVGLEVDFEPTGLGSTWSGTVFVPIAAASTSITLADSLPTSSYGQADTLMATVVRVAPSTGAPSGGTVTFYADGTSLGSAPVDTTTGKAALSTAAIDLGQHALSASFGGGPSENPSTSAVLPHVVHAAATTTKLTLKLATTVSGQSAQPKATVKAPTGGIVSSGTVVLYDGIVALGTAPVTNGVAVLPTTAALLAGSHTLTAAFVGTPTAAASTSSGVSLTVNVGASMTTVTSSAPTAAHGTAVTLTASIAPHPPATGTPTGEVTFYDGPNAIGTVPVANKKAKLAISSLAVGSHTITATYSGDASFAPSTSPGMTQTIT